MPHAEATDSAVLATAIYDATLSYLDTTLRNER